MMERFSRWLRRDPVVVGKRVGQWISDTRDPNPHVRIKAVRVLGESEAGGARVVPCLIRVLDDDDWLVREAAAEALAMIGGDAVPALREALEHERWSVRQSAARALQKITGSTRLQGAASAALPADRPAPA